jgi:hypothetical protein
MMGEVQFKFKLPEDQDEFDIYCNASKYYCALWDVHNFIFRMYKHESPPENGTECWDQVREKLVEILQDIEFDK